MTDNRERKNQAGRSRDKTLDGLRGFAMLWVIFVHVLYWGNFFTNAYFNLAKSFCLFEMPLFFFVTGAAASLGKTGGYFSYVCKRFQRILIPYWVFAVICAAVSAVKYGMEGSLTFGRAIKVFLSWIVPINRQMTSVSYLTWALWFIPVYLSVVLIIPPLKSMKKSQHRIAWLFALTGVFAASCMLKMDVIRYIAFYALWTYIGLFYGEIKLAATRKRARMYFICAAIVGGGGYNRVIHLRGSVA